MSFPTCFDPNATCLVRNTTCFFRLLLHTFFQVWILPLIVWVRCVLFCTCTRRLVDSAAKATGCGQAAAKTGLDIHSFYFFMQDLNSCGFEYDLISIEKRFRQGFSLLLSAAFHCYVLSYQRANQIHSVA